MNFRLLPIIYVLLFAVLMFCITQVVPLLTWSFAGQIYLAATLFALGVIIIILGAIQFWQVGTTVNPGHPEDTTKLVVSGLYRWSRNPMYLGFLFILISWAVYLGSLAAMMFLPGFVWIITRVYILSEEQVLADKFGETFRSYQSRVRRWI